MVEAVDPIDLAVPFHCGPDHPAVWHAVHVDRLAPDTSYHLDCSSELGFIGCDTAYFMREFHPNPTAFIDGWVNQRPRDGQRWLEHLRHSDLYLENAYITWRDTHRTEARQCSLKQARFGRGHLRHVLSDVALGMVNEGMAGIPRHPTGEQMARFVQTTDVYRRSHNRMLADLEHTSLPQLEQLRAEAFARTELGRRAAVLSVEEQMELHSRLLRERQQRKRRDRRLRRQQQRMARRSAELLAEIKGPQAVSLFIGQQKLRVAGQWCDYLLSGSRVMHGFHGCQTELVVRGTEDVIARMCIYTPETPMLDHVVNLVFHIENGAELELLQIGNLYNINYDRLEQIPELVGFARPRPVTLPGANFACNPDGSGAIEIADLPPRFQSAFDRLGQAEWQARQDQMMVDFRQRLPEAWFTAPIYERAERLNSDLQQGDPYVLTQARLAAIQGPLHV